MFGAITASKREQHEHVDEEELNDVDNHSAERDLQRPQMGINAEYMYQFQKAANTPAPSKLMFLSRARGNDVYLNIIAAENIPSDNSIGSKGCQSSRGYHGSQPSQYSLCNGPKIHYSVYCFNLSTDATDNTGMLPLRFIGVPLCL